MMGFMTSLQETSLALWVSGSSSLLGYPTILVLHTVGLAMLVGANLVVDFRILGVARGAPWPALYPLFRLMWIGFALNAITGLLLFIADAVRKVNQPVFLVKLAFIAVAIMVLVLIQRAVGAVVQPPVPGEPGAKLLAVLSLVLWAGAIVAGRLVAYMPVTFIFE